MEVPIILATIIATTHMTILNYLFSATFREFYSEPLFVKYVANRLDKSISIDSERILGWFIPYFSGLLFVVGFNLLFAYHLIDLSWRDGLLFGCLAGCIGIGWWHLMFRVTYTVDIDFKRYCRPLLLTYIVFGVTVVGIYRLFLD